MVEGGCRGPWGRSCSSSMECLTCWSVWGCCCWGSEGRSAVCEWECVSRRGVTVRQRRGGEREGEGYREWHIENLDFRQLVRQHLLSSSCVAEQLIREMSSVMYGSFLSALTGSLSEVGCCAGRPALTPRLGHLSPTLHSTRFWWRLISFKPC